MGHKKGYLVRTQIRRARGGYVCHFGNSWCHLMTRAYAMDAELHFHPNARGYFDVIQNPPSNAEMGEIASALTDHVDGMQYLADIIVSYLDLASSFKLKVVDRDSDAQRIGWYLGKEESWPKKRTKGPCLKVAGNGEQQVDELALSFVWETPREFEGQPAG